MSRVVTARRALPTGGSTGRRARLARWSIAAAPIACLVFVCSQAHAGAKLRARPANPDGAVTSRFAVSNDGAAGAGEATCQWTEGVSSFPGVDGENVSATAVFDDGSGPALYVGGSFTVAGDVVASNIAKWDGSNWSPLGSGMNDAVFTLTVFDDGSGPALYAAGRFTTAGGVSANRIAKWDPGAPGSWSPLGSGMGGVSFPFVSALTVFDDGSGPALYAGGDFLTSGGVSASHIAKWDGSSWSALGTGMDFSVFALTVFDDGSGPALYAGGLFTTAGGVGANRIAKWDPGAPGSWSPLGSGMNNTVRTLTVFDDGGGPALYAGGAFTIAGGVSANRIAKWDPGAPGSWSPLGSGMDGWVSALRVFDDGSGPALYAGGFFTTAGGVGASNIAKWDPGAPGSWSPLGSGMNDTVFTLTVFDDGGGPALYAGGFFTNAGGVRVNGIAKWDPGAPGSWSPLGSGMGGVSFPSVSALTVFDDGSGPALYAGGFFATAGDMSASSIAKWNGSNWSPLGSGMSGGVSALMVFDDGSGPALYAAGNFVIAGGVIANRIAKWDGASWSPLGSGMDGGDSFPFVSALTVFDDGSGPALYATGRFTIAGGVSANRIAKWDGASWSPLGSGMGGASFPSAGALTVFNDGSGPALYAAGSFTTAGGVSASRIAKWDPGAPGSWSPLGSGMDGASSPFVSALTVFDDGGGPALYAGGQFFTAGGVDANRIARWDGSSWSPLGSGMDNEVLAFTVFDDGSGPALYAGGSFTAAGGHVSAFISRWSCCPDGDGDEVCGADDACPDSITDDTIVIEGCDSGVDNVLFDDGCTMSDHVYACAADAKNHGRFVSCVAKLSNEWLGAGSIAVNEHGPIQRCAAWAPLPARPAPR